MAYLYKPKDQKEGMTSLFSLPNLHNSTTVAGKEEKRSRDDEFHNRGCEKGRHWKESRKAIVSLLFNHWVENVPE